MRAGKQLCRDQVRFVRKEEVGGEARLRFVSNSITENCLAGIKCHWLRFSMPLFSENDFIACLRTSQFAFMVE